MMAQDNPPHPGEIVRWECLEPLGLTVTRAAEGLGCNPPGAFLSGEWEGRRIGRDGHSPVPGVWVFTGNLAWSTGGL